MINRTWILVIFFLNIISIFSCQANDVNYARVYPSQEYSLIEVNTYERERKFSEADLFYSNMQKDDYLNYLISERKFLRNSDFEWVDESAEDLYLSLKNSVLQRTSLKDYIPPTINFNVIETSAFFALNSVDFCEILITDKSESLYISRLYETNNGAFFLVSGFDFTNMSDEWFKNYRSMIFVVNKIEDSIFPKIENSYEMSFIYLADFKFEDEMIQYFDFENLELDYSKKLVYGVKP